MTIKPVEWLGDSRKTLKQFPATVQRRAGFELRNVQQGVRATDSKMMPSVGSGVEEIRVWDESGTYRVIHLAKFVEAVYVLHVFQKKTQQTSQRDVEVARVRLNQLIRERKKKGLL
jgi:phage-related protein